MPVLVSEHLSHKNLLLHAAEGKQTRDQMFALLVLYVKDFCRRYLMLALQVSGGPSSMLRVEGSQLEIVVFVLLL